MGSEIIINVEPYETRVALLENNTISEIFIERSREKGMTGNIFDGTIVKILPGMQVAFVDIGLERSGFLHQSDINMGEYGVMPNFGRSQDQNGEMAEDLDSYFNREGFLEAQRPIEERIKQGQEIMVQVVKDPIGSKGARISSYITLPGRYLVYMPSGNQLGISRRIEGKQERERLQGIVDELRQPNKGYIIRTAAEGATREELKSDIDFLDRMWEGILAKNEHTSAPSLIHRDLDIVLRALRDLCSREVTKIVIDSQADYKRCVEFTEKFLKDTNPIIELYTGSEPIFDAYDLEIEIERALGRKVWLKSGGSIVIDQTEALVAIDVNTGKFVGKRSQEETILKTNLEAVKEIVFQLKLRNIGGLIIIDFIDMEKESSKEKVYNALEHALRTDRSRTTILRVSELGLVEMTRKRTRESISQVLWQMCPHCEGKGMTKSPRTISYEIFREIERVAGKNPITRKILLNVSPRIGDNLLEEENEYIEKLESKTNVEVKINVLNDLSDEDFEVSTLDINLK